MVLSNMDKSNDAPRLRCSFFSVVVVVVLLVLVVVESDLVVGCLRIESKARGAAVARRFTGLRMFRLDRACVRCAIGVFMCCVSLW